MKEIFKDLKKIGFINHLSHLLLTLFFLVISVKLKLDFELNSLIYWYVACLLVGHYSAHNIKPTKKYKYIKGKGDTFVALPLVGLINMLTFGIPILILNFFFSFLW